MEVDTIDKNVFQRKTVCISCFQPLMHGFCFNCSVNYILCFSCETNFETFLEFRDHMKVHHVSEYDRNKIISIDFKIKRKKCLRRLFICQLCSDLFNKPADLLKHRSKVHESSKDFKCTYCDRTFLRKASLSYHSRCHTQQFSFGCKLCNKQFYTPGRLTHHMKRHKSKSYVCDFCSKTFSELFVLKRHYKQHAEEKLFKCNECGKSFRFNFTLKRHEKIHTTLEKFECDTCHAKFSRKSDMKRHWMKHLQIKSFQCSICDKSFLRNSYLTDHMMSHGTSKKYLCFCGKSFRYLSGLSRHKKTHEAINIIENNMDNK